MSLFETIGNIDKKIFLRLNGLHNVQLDNLMYWMSNEAIWVPFYLCLIGLVIYFFRQKSWVIIIFLILLITSTDQTSGLIKRTVQRPRPCHNTEIGPEVHIVKDCGGKYGFISSHAANTFALAMFMTLLLVHKYEYVGWLLFPWAALISFSRIYLGVHYPADITVGALLGLSLGYLFFKACKKILHLSI